MTLSGAMLFESNPLVKVIPGLMIWTLISFAITFWVLKRYAFGPIQKLIDERRDRIRQSVEEADRVRDEARSLLEEHKQLVAQARGEAEAILGEARRIGDAQQQRMREETEADRQRRLEETERQIEQAKVQIFNELREEVGRLSIEAAAKVAGLAIKDADQQRLIDEALAEIDFTQLEASRS
jgi:F-type H+-transporting ATPase subunit b